MRVILDTNLWISYLISNRHVRLDELIESDECVLLFSAELINEFVIVAERPKFEKYFSQDEVMNLIEQINSVGELIEVHSDLQLCRDEKDNFLLNLAKDGNADFLVTGDKDLLEIAQINNTQILTYKDFITKLDEVD